MKKYIILLLITLAFFGCKLFPFNPKADARISTFTDTSNNAITSSKITGSAPHTIRTSIQIINGVDVNFNEYLIEYFDTTGNKYPFFVRNRTQSFVSGSGTAITTASGYIPISITNQEIIDYQVLNSIKQMMLKIYIYGLDINDHSIECRGEFSIYF